MRTTVAKLIKTAIETGENTTASDGRWKCRINKDMDAYIVTHHATDMIVYHGPKADNPGWVGALDRGWGSVTDKQGIDAMLRELHSGERYHHLFRDHDSSKRVPPPEEEGSFLEEKPPAPNLEPFEPPLRVEDSMLW